MNSPSSSNASSSSIKSNFTSSTKSSSTLSSKSSNSPSSSLKISKEQMNESGSLPIAQSLQLQIKKLKTDIITEENKENANSKNEIKVNYNPFLSNCNNNGIKLNNLIKKTNVINLNDENDYNDVGIMMESKMNLSNCKLSSCSIANLNEQLNSLNKNNFKSLPQINKIGINYSTNDQRKLANNLNCKAKLALQPNVLMKPPRMNKPALDNDLNVHNKIDKLNEIESKIDDAIDANRANSISEVKDEEPIFESRLELFGYDSKEEENHYEVADDLDEVELKKDNKDKDSNNLIPIDTYCLLVSTLNKIDEKSLNTLKKAIKKVLTDNASVKVIDKNCDNVQEEFVKNLIIDKTNQDTTINYIHNDCEYAKILPIMKKKFIKKTIVEQF